jgi:predicted KAP-like P-loop ATPase
MKTEFPNTYSFKDRDEFKREPIARNLLKLLQSDIDISPFLIDGDWGTGKSEFCHKTIKLIKESEEYKDLLPIYINAFKADSINNPLLTLIAEISKELPEESKNLKNNAISVLKSTLVNVGHDISNKLGVDSRNLLEKAKDSIELSQRQQLEVLLEDQIQAEDRVNKLKEALETLAHDKKIILFIDELDRCRPDYAIGMLETAKHIFDVEGILFILIANTKQIKASINHAYGKNMDGHKYLEKFKKTTITIQSYKSALAEDDNIKFFRKKLNKQKTLIT